RRMPSPSSTDASNSPTCDSSTNGRTANAITSIWNWCHVTTVAAFSTSKHRRAFDCTRLETRRLLTGGLGDDRPGAGNFNHAIWLHGTRGALPRARRGARWLLPAAAVPSFRRGRQRGQPEVRTHGAQSQLGNHQPCSGSHPDLLRDVPSV